MEDDIRFYFECLCISGWLHDDIDRWYTDINTVSNAADEIALSISNVVEMIAGWETK